MQNQEKIIQAIAAYLGKVMTYNNSLTKIQFERTCVNGAAEFIEQEAKQIASAIAPHLEAGAGDVDDSQYTDDFLKWRGKYFDQKTQVKHFRSKHNGEFRDIKQLERQYERAYNCNSKKTK